MHSEINTLRKEKDHLFEQITSIDVENSGDLARLQILIDNLKQNDHNRTAALRNENTHLLEVSKNLQNKLVEESSKNKVKLNKKPADKYPVKKANYLTPLRKSNAH